jgi:histidinol-phosphate aminotransferase
VLSASKQECPYREELSMADVKKLMVPWLKGCQAYFSEHIEKAWEDRSLSRMMSNEGPIPPQKEVLDQLIEGARLCHRYPDSLKHIKKKIGELNGLESDWVLLANGSTEGLDMTMRAFLRPGDAIIQSNPCYGIYSKRAALIGAETITINALDSWEYDVDNIEASISEKVRVVILANPNNPTGNLTPDSVYERLVKHNIIVICDEAYIEYSGLENSKVPIMKRNPNMVVSRTLSKAYGLAGMRFGYLLGHPETIEIISRMIMSWNVSTISAFGAYAALQDQDGLKMKAMSNNEGRDYIEEELSKIEGLNVYHTHGNYILIDATPTGATSAEIVNAVMKKNGIILRKITPFKDKTGLFRITIGTQDENKRCVKAVKAFFSSRTQGP